MVPGPKSDDWEDTIDEGAQLCEDGRQQEKWSNEEEFHRRGNYPSISAAATHGNGRLVRALWLIPSLSTDHLM